MLYFKHSELVEKYHVSLKTVHNWIDAAKQGKLSLQLHTDKARVYLADSPANITAIEKLVEEGKKFRNARYHKVIAPSEHFYEVFSRRQILDIISNLNIHREIPRQYNYLDGGAQNWDNWLRRLEAEDSPNVLTSSIKLIHANLNSIDLLLEGRSKVNVIDIGVGNALPVRELLQHLSDRKVLNRYIAIDISQSMIDIAKANVTKWFGNNVAFEGHVRDISYERFDDLLVDDMLDNDAKQTINLVLLLGGTATNFPAFSDIVKVVNGSMGENDLLVYTDKADTEVSRRYFDFHSKPGESLLAPNHRFLLELLNVDASLYDVEMGFDERKRMRYVRVRITKPITIKFKFTDSERSVTLEKGDTILLLRVWHLTALEIITEFEKSGFILLHSSLTRERQYVLTISGVDTKKQPAS